MTREEAIAILIREKDDDPFIRTEYREQIHEALNMAIKALEQEPEPVYFPPCVDCQERSKDILTAYENMKKMQTFTKEEVITMLDKIRAEIAELSHYYPMGHDYQIAITRCIAVIDKYRAEK